MHPLIQSNELWGDLSGNVCCREQNLQTALQAVPKVLHFPFRAL